MISNENVIGENIRTHRKKSKLSQKQLATAMGISTTTLSSYETGKTIPNSAFIEKLSFFFQTSTDMLLDIKEENKEASYITQQKQQDL